MDLVALTEELITSVAVNQEAVSVKEFPSENPDKEIVIQVMIDESDMGRVIGKNGKVANAIRTLVQASSYLKENKKVKINIDHFQKDACLSFLFERYRGIMKLVKNMNEILDVFYNDFIKEAATGRIDCNMFYNILFATNILRDGKVEVLTTAKTNYQNVMVPTLEIKNEREWNDLLIKYVEQAIDFYDSKDFEDVDNIPKSIMARLFANMTLEDFKEP